MVHSLENGFSDYALWNNRDQGYAASESAGVGVSQSKNTDVVLHTQDGDTVTLSASTQFAAKYATYEGLAAGGGMMAWQTGEAFELSAESRFSLTIEGDLNARERADIGKALKTIDKIMQDLVSGDFDKIMKRAMNLGRLDTVQSLSADLHYQQEIYYTHRKTEMLSTESDVSNRPQPAASPSPETIVAEDAGGAEAAAVDEMADALGAANPVNGKLISYLNRYFSELEERLEAREGRTPGDGMVDRVRSKLMARLERMRENVGARNERDENGWVNEYQAKHHGAAREGADDGIIEG